MAWRCRFLVAHKHPTHWLISTQVVADLVDPDMLPLSRLKQNLRYWQTKKHARRWEAAAKLEGPLKRPA